MPPLGTRRWSASTLPRRIASLIASWTGSVRAGGRLCGSEEHLLRPLTGKCRCRCPIVGPTELLPCRRAPARWSGPTPSRGGSKVADPPYVLQQLRKITGTYLILQTSSVLPGSRNRARFVVRRDRTAEGLVSIRGGEGVWKFSAPCVREMLAHAGFETLEERRPRRRDRRDFPLLCLVAARSERAIERDVPRRSTLGVNRCFVPWRA